MQPTLLITLVLLCGEPALRVWAAPRQVDSEQLQQQEVEDADSEDASDGVSLADSFRSDLLLAAMSQTIQALKMNQLVDEYKAAALRKSKQFGNYVLPTPGIITVPGKKSIPGERGGNWAPDLSAAGSAAIARQLSSSDVSSEDRRRLSEVWRRWQDLAA